MTTPRERDGADSGKGATATDVEAAFSIAHHRAGSLHPTAVVEEAEKAVRDIENEVHVYEPLHSRALAAFREVVRQLSEPTEFARFEALTRRLLTVPKKELDEKRKGKSLDHKNTQPEPDPDEAPKRKPA